MFVTRCALQRCIFSSVNKNAYRILRCISYDTHGKEKTLNDGNKSISTKTSILPHERGEKEAHRSYGERVKDSACAGLVGSFLVTGTVTTFVLSIGSICVLLSDGNPFPLMGISFIVVTFLALISD